MKLSAGRVRERVPPDGSRAWAREFVPELVTWTTAREAFSDNPVISALQAAPLLTICMAVSPLAIFANAAMFMLPLLHEAGTAYEFSGVRDSCLRFQNLWVGLRGPSERYIPSPQRGE